MSWQSNYVAPALALLLMWNSRLRKRLLQPIFRVRNIDVVSIRRVSRIIADLLAAQTEALNPANPNNAQQLSRLKSGIARQVRAGRARAMLDAADVVPGRTPAWMISAHTPVAAWLGWTRCANEVVGATQSTQDDPLAAGSIQTQSTIGGYTMILCGGVYMRPQHQPRHSDAERHVHRRLVRA